MLFITPLLRHILPLESFNALSAGLMMGIMITPAVGSISLDAIQAVPRSLREGEITQEPEVVLLVKTQAGLQEEIETAIYEHISYTNFIAQLSPSAVN